MQIRIDPDQLKRLTDALDRAGKSEIGGQLFGRQLAPSKFLVTEVVIQKRKGSYARFLVDLIQAARDAMKFFDRTGHDYTLHNYIGEWHSHPSFSVCPSLTDVETMRALVRDPEFRGTFAILMIARLDSASLSLEPGCSILMAEKRK